MTTSDTSDLSMRRLAEMAGCDEPVLGDSDWHVAGYLGQEFLHLVWKATQQPELRAQARIKDDPETDWEVETAYQIARELVDSLDDDDKWRTFVDLGAYDMPDARPARWMSSTSNLTMVVRTGLVVIAVNLIGKLWEKNLTSVP